LTDYAELHGFSLGFAGGGAMKVARGQRRENPARDEQAVQELKKEPYTD
jgi:hypothetical protein